MTLTTDRLRFRSWRPDDGPLALSLWTDPEVVRFLGPAPTPDQALARLQAEIRTESEHGIQYWPMFHSDDLVGCCGLRPREPAVPEIGFHLLPAYWGRGLAHEAATAVIGRAGELGATALFAGHHPDNTASRGLLLRLGFRWTHDEPYAPTGRLHPSYRLDR